MEGIIKGSNQFRQVMFLIVVLGILTNVCIVGLLIYLSAFQVLFSPISGSLLFITFGILLYKSILNVKPMFILFSLTVVSQVIIQTHYLGWESGNYYFLYALSIVFLLDFSWRLPSVILYNGFMIALTALLAHTYKGEAGTYFVPANFLSFLNSFNQANVAIIILIIIIFASDANKRNHKAIKLVNLELEQQNKEILEQRDHLEILLKEVHHRVKNNLQVISSLLSLQQNSITDEKMISILDVSKARVEAIALIHQNLYSNNRGNQVDFNAYLSDLVHSQQIIQSNIKCSINSNHIILDLDTAVPLGIIISEMMTNSVKHAFKETEKPNIDITFIEKGKEYNMYFKDNGIGLPQDFDLNHSESLGMVIISALIDQIEGELSFSNDSGAFFKIVFARN